MEVKYELTHTDNGQVITWPHLKSGDEGQPLDIAANLRSVQVIGDFDNGTLSIDASNDGEHYDTIATTRRPDILENVSTTVGFIRPSFSDGGKDGEVTVILFQRR